MKTYNVHEAKTNLSKILNEVKEGEIVYIAKSGKRVAELKPILEKKKKIPWGKYKDKIKVSEDWNSDEVNEEIAKGLNLDILEE
ncbi:MAG: type II toxin-antitoxin system prevent-host-death family antitoxin [Cyclobacteriaceae bacterium]